MPQPLKQQRRSNPLTPCIWRGFGLDHAEPTERFSTANDYYPTACDSCRGGTWVRTKLGRVLMRSHHGRSLASASSRRWPSTEIERPHSCCSARLEHGAPCGSVGG